ncbi:MAG: type I DNA topoisomerase [Rikenellaceae bacterium]|nr:type I DNA topoisomerase [Rikenellaceae bacterium]
MQDNLVIVESPSKAKTIEKFLGKEFVVRSSFGHIRDLVKKGIGVDIENGFEPKYEISANKKKLVTELSEMAAKARKVWLASDEDREGEAIAWHLTQVLGLPEEKTNRIVFHEITKNAILRAIEEPRSVNMDIVNAQQARRILDRLVGFELSPLLWKKVKPQLSAGRVQSVTVRLIVEREREIMAFESTEYYRITAKFYAPNDPNKALINAELNHKFATRAEAEAFLESCCDAVWSVDKCETKPITRYPSAPFTTSTLQQEAGRKLNMSVSQTMSIAQKLYESGLITYMRTDSVNLSSLAIGAAKQEITAQFGEEYASSRNYKTKSKGAQEAHEAIRPTYFDRREIEGTPTEKKLYDLIWKRAVASQMAAAELNKTTITIVSDKSDKVFTATGESIVFDGFMRLYTESTDDENNTESAVLPALTSGEQMMSDSIVATQRFTQAPSRYNEALLVKKLEELGIGRPSTYAPTISTVITRGYVVKQNREGVRREFVQLTLKKGKISEKTMSEKVGKESNRLLPTDIGMLVNDYLEAQFSNILDYNFTANVEKEFDKIAEGAIEWEKMIAEFYGGFHASVENALESQATSTNQPRILGTDPKTGYVVSARIGKFGPMVQMDGPEGEKPRYASLKKGQLVASITLEEALELLSLPRTLGELDGKEVVVSIGKFGPYVRYDGKFVSLGKKDDPYTVSYERACEIIEESRSATSKANTPIQTFEGEDIVVKNGRYGAYIASGGKNYKIPRGKSAESLTLEECKAIIAAAKK